MNAAEPFTARQAIACGVLWAITVTTIETLSVPLSAMSEPAMPVFIAMLFGVYLIAGITWSVMALRLRRAPPYVGIAAIILLAPLLAVVHVATVPLQALLMPGDGLVAMIGQHSELALFCYAIWVNAFYGSLYVLGFTAAQRTLTLRALVARAASARAEMMATMASRRLANVRGQLQPELLRDAIHAIRAGYACGDRGADRCFDALVDFLRAAMPGVRETTTSLQAELNLVHAWLALERATGVQRCVGAVLESAGATAFPALSLLPLIAALSQNGRVTVDGTAGGDYRLRIDAPGAALDGPAGTLLGRLCISLNAMHHGHATHKVVRGSDDRATITLTIPLETTRHLQGELGCAAT